MTSTFYFSDCITVDAVKKQYRQLAFTHHPDRDGDHATMQRINAEYHEALKRCHLQSSYTEEGKEYTYKYNQSVEESVIQAISALLALNMQDVKIALIGTWVWVIGETRPYKDALKAIGCKWHKTRACWYYSAQPHKGYYSKGGFDSLAMRYGYHDLTNAKRNPRTIEQ